jgi:hypothetical protein
LFDKEIDMLQVAETFVAQHGVQDRVRMQVGDMLNDPFPAADLHLPYNDARTGPLPIAAMTLTALLRGEAGRYSARDYAGMLSDAGFIDIEVKPTVGYWSLITGRRP